MSPSKFRGLAGHTPHETPAAAETWQGVRGLKMVGTIGD
jgi:hypothetical protein